jgi:hypothetical protein
MNRVSEAAQGTVRLGAFALVAQLKIKMRPDSTRKASEITENVVGIGDDDILHYYPLAKT